MKEYRKQICKLLDSGISNMSEIGRQVGCTRENVRQLLTDSGHYKNGCRLDRNKALILELRGAGYSQPEVAKRIGCTATAIHAALKRWGVGRGVLGKGIIEKRKDEVIKLWAMGRAQREIAREIGCSEEGVFCALKRWGVGRGSVRSQRIKQ